VRQLEPCDRFVIVASDGRWAVLASDEAVRIVARACAGVLGGGSAASGAGAGADEDGDEDLGRWVQDGGAPLSPQEVSEREGRVRAGRAGASARA
jgi:hypothetical protein